MYRKVAVDSTHRRNKAIGQHQVCHGLKFRVGYNKVQKVKNNEGRREKERCKIMLLQDAKKQLPS